jgi:ATP-binding cassette subfamily C protein CydC
MTRAVHVVRLLAPWRARAVASVALSAAAVCAAVALMMTSGHLISRAALRPPILDLMIVIVAVRFFALARPTLRYVERLVSHDVTFRLLLAIRRWFYEGLLPLAPARLPTFRAGDLLSRLTADVESLQDVFLRLVSPILVALTVGLVVVGALALVDGRLAIAVAFLLLLNGAIWPWISTRWARGIGERHIRERGAMTAHLVAMLQGKEDLLACGQERAYLARASSHQAELDRIERSLGRLAALNTAIGSGLAQFGLWTTLVLALPLVANGRLPGVWLAGLVLGVVAAFEAVEALPQAWLTREQLDDAARRVFAVVHAQPAVVDVAVASAAVPDTAPAIRFSNVSFAYDAAAGLQEVSFFVPHLARVAIVGSTGAGKSSLLSLLTRTWDPQHGSIELNGCDLRRFALSDLRRAMAVMPQQVHVFDESLGDNLRLARPSASDADLREVLQNVGLEKFLADRPERLDTRLGEHGVRMSAGERQRLGLARVMLTDAPLILLDEPTANLDTITEREVLRAITRWTRDRTLLVVTHRLMHLEAMDRIVVLERGRVAEQGRHEELVSREGPYRRLWLCQQGLLVEDTCRRR